MFNFWRKYPRRKPKSIGHYLCTIDDGYTNRIMVLFYNHNHKWKNLTRQTVFEGYQVYKHCRATIQENRVYTDGLCERDDVVAWKKLPRAYGRK